MKANFLKLCLFPVKIWECRGNIYRRKNQNCEEVKTGEGLLGLEMKGSCMLVERGWRWGCLCRKRPWLSVCEAMIQFRNCIHHNKSIRNEFNKILFWVIIFHLFGFLWEIKGKFYFSKILFIEPSFIKYFHILKISESLNTAVQEEFESFKRFKFLNSILFSQHGQLSQIDWCNCWMGGYFHPLSHVFPTVHFSWK